MRFLVTGINGMTGSYVKKIFRKYEIISPPKYTFNIGNNNQVMKLKDTRIEFIIHLAAETDHEYCDMNPAQAYYINTIGTANLTRLAIEKDIPILYLSAGSIFDGKKAIPYTTKDQPNPMNHYNISKWYGEMIVKNNPKHYIVRSGWMFGGGIDRDKKFVNKIMTKYYNGQREIKVCDDCIGSPTYAKDLINWIKILIESKKKYGTYHCVNLSDGISRWQYGKMVFEALKDDTVKIIPCLIEELKDEFPCKRTNYEVLSCDFPENMRPWDKALKEYVHESYYKH